MSNQIILKRSNKKGEVVNKIEICWFVSISYKYTGLTVSNINLRFKLGHTRSPHDFNKIFLVTITLF